MQLTLISGGKSFIFQGYNHPSASVVNVMTHRRMSLSKPHKICSSFSTKHKCAYTDIWHEPKPWHNKDVSWIISIWASLLTWGSVCLCVPQKPSECGFSCSHLTVLWKDQRCQNKIKRHGPKVCSITGSRGQGGAVKAKAQEDTNMQLEAHLCCRIM